MMNFADRETGLERRVWDSSKGWDTALCEAYWGKGIQQSPPASVCPNDMMMAGPNNECLLSQGTKYFTCIFSN